MTSMILDMYGTLLSLHLQNFLDIQLLLFTQQQFNFSTHKARSTLTSFTTSVTIFQSALKRSERFDGMTSYVFCK